MLFSPHFLIARLNDTVGQATILEPGAYALVVFCVVGITI